MAMTRAAKESWVEGANSIFGESEIVLITQYQGLNVAEISALRSQVREAGASFKVAKNRLAKRAIEGTNFAALSDHFTGPTAICFGMDPVSAAKVIATFAKGNDKLKLIGGAFGETLLDEAKIKQLATMPSLDELRGKIVALLNTPATRMAGVLQAPAGQLARVFGAYAASGE
jgi:large subunit ribosomal protein L10